MDTSDIDVMLLARYVIVVLALLYLYATGGLNATVVGVAIVGIIFPTTHALSVFGVSPPAQTTKS
jgi:hypothetical protein